MFGALIQTSMGPTCKGQMQRRFMCLLSPVFFSCCACLSCAALLAFLIHVGLGLCRTCVLRPQAKANPAAGRRRSVQLGDQHGAVADVAPGGVAGPLHPRGRSRSPRRQALPYPCAVAPSRLARRFAALPSVRSVDDRVKALVAVDADVLAVTILWRTD